MIMLLMSNQVLPCVTIHAADFLSTRPSAASAGATALSLRRRTSDLTMMVDLIDEASDIGGVNSSARKAPWLRRDNAAGNMIVSDSSLRKVEAGDESVQRASSSRSHSGTGCRERASCAQGDSGGGGYRQRGSLPTQRQYHHVEEEAR